MKRTSGLIVLALAVLVLRGAAPAPARVVQTPGPATIHANHSKTSIVPAEDSGDDDGGDDGGSGDTE